MKREAYKSGESTIPAEWKALPNSRKTAHTIGATHYFTGTSCEHGHIDRRYTSSGGCLACSRAADHDRYSKMNSGKPARAGKSSRKPILQQFKGHPVPEQRAIHVEAVEDGKGRVKVLWAAIASTQDELNLIVQHRRGLRRKGLPVPSDLA